MKKKMFSVKNTQSVANAIMKARAVRNTLNEKGQGMMDAVIEALDTLSADAEVEYDEDAVKEAILEIVNKNVEVPEAVADAIAKKVASLQNSIKPTSKELSAKVKNEVAKAILTNKKEDIQDAVNAVLVKNDITGLTFSDVIDYAVVDDFGNENPLFSQLFKTPISKFFYTAQDIAEASEFAHQWLKTSNNDKSIQELEVTGKSISTKYIYKRQKFAQEDLDDVRESGGEATLLKWVTDELNRHVVNMIVRTILIGDNINASADRVTSFEAIGLKSESDVFTSIATAAAATPTLAEVRAVCDVVMNPNGKKKVAVMPQSVLTAISEFKYSGTGSIMYRSKEEIAGQIGVDEIYVTDILAQSGVDVVVLLPQGYWYKEKNTINVTYPTYERNEVNYQVEKNIGGKIHDLFSTAVLKSHQG